MLLVFFRKLIVAALFAAAVAVTAVAALKTSDLTCDVLSQVVSQGACLSDALNAYFGLEGSAELACQLYDPKNQWYLYVDKKTSGTSSSNVGQIASAINKHPNYDGVNLAAKWSVNRFLLASAGSDQAACKDATAILRQLVTESCETNGATGAVSCTVCNARQYKVTDSQGKVTSCVCKDGYTGANCDTCKGGYTGTNCDTCKPNFTGANCDLCTVGYTGANCDTCKPNFTGANCDTCKPGFTGADCDVCKVGYTGTNCDTCKPGFTSTTPACDPGYTACCNGKCIFSLSYIGDGYDNCGDGSDESTPPFQSCGLLRGSNCDVCKLGFTGATCETNLNDCYPWTCSSHGTCTDGIDAFTCKCDQGWTGTRCESSVNDCAANGCGANNGPCIDGDKKFCCDGDMKGCGANKRFAVGFGASGSPCTAMCTACPAGAAEFPGSNHRMEACYEVLLGDGVLRYGLISTLTGHSDNVESVAWSPDGSKIASGSRDNSVKIWNAAAGTIIATLTGHSDYIWSVAWSPDGSKIASGSEDDSVKIWNAAAGTIIAMLTGHSSWVYSVAWSPDGSKIASGSLDDSVKIWNAAASTIIATLTGHSHAVYSVAWSPDGSKIASGSLDDSVKILDSAPMCVGKGLYLNVANNECTGCPANTYNAFDVHQEASCFEIPPCNPGFRFAAASNPAEEKRTCEPCGDKNYISTPNHRTETCLDQPTCNPGDQISAYSAIAKQTCTTLNECLEDVQQETASTYCNTKLAGHDTFGKLRDAQLMCAADEACTGVADGSCNGGPYALCATITSSTQGACTWQKVNFKHNTCSGRGTCKDGINEYTCTCDDGFGGADCNRSTVYCSEGQAYSRLENKCSPCEQGTTYMDETKHRNENCIPQATCGVGEKISEYSATSAQTCMFCSPGTYQDLADHREESCKKQMQCDPGFQISAPSTTVLRNCTPCGKNTFVPYTNHREEACFRHVNCTAGEAITADDPERQRTCSVCGLHTYQNITSHRVEACTPQPGCPRGHAYYAENKTSERRCLPCASGKYMSSDDHRKNECTEQTQCNPGFKISAPSTTAAQSCTACENNTFVEATNHREERCTLHATCGPGEYSLGLADPTRQRTCLMCGLHRYQNLISHTVEECNMQPVCKPGEYYSLLPLASKAAKAECRPCTNGTYQDEQQHRNDKCEEQIKCLEKEGVVLNYTGSITVASGCIPITVQSQDQEALNNSTTIVIVAAAGGFVLLLGILIFIVILVRRRAAAKRAEDALNVAREALEINCTSIKFEEKANHQLQCMLCGDSSDSSIPDVVVSTPAPQHQLLHAANQNQCNQKTSKGTQCQNMAISGSTKCVDHTCQFPGCIAIVSSKTPCCKTHSNVPSGIAVTNAAHTVSNQAFVGVVFSDTVAGWGNDSSTDTNGATTAVSAPPLPPMSPAVQAAAAAITQTKFVAPAKTLKLGANTWGAVGLTNVMGVDERTYRYLTEQKAINKMISEFKRSGTEQDQQTIAGLIDGTYCNPNTPTNQLLSLSEIMSSLEVLALVKHGFKCHHALAIRVYTTKCYQSINKPMRAHPHPQLPHPFAATVYYVTTGLEILRLAAGAASKKDAETKKTLWRGMTDVGIAEDFTSGTDMACMSTTEDPEVAMEFANEKGFIFRVLCANFMNQGAAVKFLSVYPEEEEVLYPPLTYIQKVTKKKVNKKDQKAIDKMRRRNIKVITVEPSYPKT